MLCSSRSLLSRSLPRRLGSSSRFIHIDDSARQLPISPLPGTVLRAIYHPHSSHQRPIISILPISETILQEVIVVNHNLKRQHQLTENILKDFHRSINASESLSSKFGKFVGIGAGVAGLVHFFLYYTTTGEMKSLEDTLKETNLELRKLNNKPSGNADSPVVIEEIEDDEKPTENGNVNSKHPKKSDGADNQKQIVVKDNTLESEDEDEEVKSEKNVIKDGKKVEDGSVQGAGKKRKNESINQDIKVGTDLELKNLNDKPSGNADSPGSMNEGKLLHAPPVTDIGKHLSGEDESQ